MQETQEAWTVLRLMEWSTQYLEKKSVEDARLNVERMLGHVLNCDRVQLYLKFDRPLEQDELQNFKQLLLRRARREPLQYILGETEFFSRPFYVEPGVLIPRPETEILVQHVLSLFESRRQKTSIIDIGAGSGIIAISIAKELPDAQITALDNSIAALKTARKNAERHGVESRIQFIHADFLSWGKSVTASRGFDLIVSNPPYIPFSEKESLAPEVREFEPAEALFTEDPFFFYKALAGFAKKALLPNGYIACEIAPNLSEGVSQIFQNTGLIDIAIVNDLADKPRIVSGRRTAGNAPC